MTDTRDHPTNSGLGARRLHGSDIPDNDDHVARWNDRENQQLVIQSNFFFGARRKWLALGYSSSARIAVRWLPRNLSVRPRGCQLVH